MTQPVRKAKSLAQVSYDTDNVLFLPWPSADPKTREAYERDVRAVVKEALNRLADVGHMACGIGVAERFLFGTKE